MTNLIQVAPGTATLWQDTSGDLAFTLNNLASGAGRQGAVLDLGAATVRAYRFAYAAWVEFATAPVLGEVVNVYLKFGNVTVRGNDDGTGDIAVSAEDKLRNLMLLDVISVDQATLNIPMATFGVVEILHREVMPVFWVSGADNLRATNNTSGFQLIEMPDRIADDA